ncbi:MAG: tetratricopeptide repeat protein [Bacteroidetes bacterium]|nr:tetratricopeptide repeat protein [Bacteroidota bacterium]
MVMRLVLFRVVFLVFSVVLGLSKVHAGAEQDSAFVKTLINNAKEVAERNFDSAHLIFEQAKSKARTIGKQVLYADVMMEEGVVFFYEGMYQQAIKLFKEAGIVYNNTKLYSREAQCYSNIGLCFQYINDYSSSLQYLFRSLGIAEKYNDIENILSSCLNLGIAYSDLRYWDNSLVYYNKAGKYAAQNKDTFILAKVNNNLAEVFYEKKEFDTAKNILKEQ